jgi:hypothetical protein
LAQLGDAIAVANSFAKIFASRDLSALWRINNASPSDYAGLVLPAAWPTSICEDELVGGEPQMASATGSPDGG